MWSKRWIRWSCPDRVKASICPYLWPHQEALYWLDSGMNSWLCSLSDVFFVDKRSCPISRICLLHIYCFHSVACLQAVSKHFVKFSSNCDTAHSVRSLVIKYLVVCRQSNVYQLAWLILVIMSLSKTWCERYYGYKNLTFSGSSLNWLNSDTKTILQRNATILLGGVLYHRWNLE